MRYTAIRNALSVVLMLGASVSTSCAMPANRPARLASAILHDPLLGLPFQSSGKGFELAPADLAQRCPALANPRYTQQLWIFAQAQRDGQRYLIVAGRFIPRRAGDRPVENALGTLLRLGAGDCTLIGPAAELFAMPEAYEDTVPAPIRSALGEDAARRSIAGHGGPAGLGAAMRKAGKTVGSLPTALKATFATVPGLPR